MVTTDCILMISFSLSVSEEKTGSGVVGAVLGISLILNLIVIVSLYLAFTSDRQSEDQFQRKVVRRNESVANIPIFQEKLNFPQLTLKEEQTGPSLSESFSQYPLAVQEAISHLKSQYELEDGDIETVVQNLWTEDTGYRQVNRERKIVYYKTTISRRTRSVQKKPISLSRDLIISSCLIDY